MPAQITRPSRLSISIDGIIKVSHDKFKFTQYVSMNPALQRIIKGKSNTRREMTDTVEKARK